MTLLLVGCGSRLQVDRSPPGDGSGGIGGTSGLPAGFAKGGQSGSAPVGPGSLGERCIQGATNHEATGTFAETEIVELDHCNDGLDCGPNGICVAAPHCPQASGVCVVRPADPGGNSGGAAGSAGFDGFGGQAYAHGTPAFPEPTITALAADDAHLYWAEYGTRDSLGSYRNDGVIMSFAFDDGTIQQVAGALPGPVGLGVTSTRLYVYVDGGPLIGSVIHSQLLRLPLTGGEPELVEDGTAPGEFQGARDLAFWTAADALKSVGPEVGAVPSVAFTGYVWGLRADETTVYFAGSLRPDDGNADDAVIQSRSVVGGPVNVLGLSPLTFAIKDDFLYGIEQIDNSTGLILNRAPKTGGNWQRTRALGAGGSTELRIAGDRYFWFSAPAGGGPFTQGIGGRVTIQTASFTTDVPPVRLLEQSVPRYGTFVWIGTATSLYWTNGSAIYARAL
jgi:hypothetical protein